MTYEDMIIEAIISYGEEGRAGLGRPTLKKVILAKHPDTGKLPLSSFSTHLNSAIAVSYTHLTLPTILLV